MKILEITEFSAGACGVWTRVLSESKEFIKLGHKVTVFSSNIEKGTDKTVKSEECIDKIEIKRLKSTGVFYGMPKFTRKLFSGNPTYFNFKKELMELKPDVVITHLWHHHSIRAINLCRELGIKCFLVPHAPFNVKRKFPLNLATWFFNNISAVSPLTSGKRALRKFHKVIAITKWEIPYLLNLGVDKNKIVYIPNGIPDEYFTQKAIKPKKDVLFLGRIASVKDIETLLKATKEIPDINFDIVGPAEENYLKKLELTKNVKILKPVYDLKEKIKIIDEHKIFVLPSKREAMPQVLLEAMSRGKLVISSETDGGKEIIKNGKTGLLFEIGDYKELANLIKKNIKGNKTIQNNAKKEAKNYSWSNLVKEYVKIF
ncbi:MAG: glycosyltransferase family 4 protein [Candidatus Nanoarchaeia archaeon]|nr:glycosyltransferase family 4 protein [Candidatus Nanoarchaeia archaeon]MDD5587615.1 glycosyltransferase family 4 protein [Candidatus Nanoarchaeia archaeon]